MKIASSAVLSPSCIFSPTSPQEVSQTVKLFTDNQCKFAVRGGGHSAVPGAANTKDGILIVTEGLNEHALTNENSVWLGAELTLGEAYGYLGAYHKSVVAGRYYPVGTGLLLGAGLSFFGNEYGLAIDNVKTYEVVLYNGTVPLFIPTQPLTQIFTVRLRVVATTLVSSLDTSSLPLTPPDWIWGGMVYYNQS